jgi:hypothetical protein
VSTKSISESVKKTSVPGRAIKRRINNNFLVMDNYSLHGGRITEGNFHRGRITEGNKKKKKILHIVSGPGSYQ